MTSTPNIEEESLANPIDNIIGLLNTGDEIALSEQLEQLHITEVAASLESLPPDLRQ